MHSILLFEIGSGRFGVTFSLLFFLAYFQTLFKHVQYILKYIRILDYYFLESICFRQLIARVVSWSYIIH